MSQSVKKFIGEIEIQEQLCEQILTGHLPKPGMSPQVAVRVVSYSEKHSKKHLQT